MCSFSSYNVEHIISPIRQYPSTRRQILKEQLLRNNTFNTLLYTLLPYDSNSNNMHTYMRCIGVFFSAIRSIISLKQQNGAIRERRPPVQREDHQRKVQFTKR